MKRVHLCLALVMLPNIYIGADESQDPVVIRLDPTKAIALALEKNLSIRAGRITPEIAEKNIVAELAAFDPRISGNYTRSESSNREPVDPFSPVRPPDSEVITDRAGARIEGLLPWGMNYDFGTSFVNNRGTFNAFRDEYNTQTGINITQPVLRGFGTDVTLVPLRVARLGRIRSDWDYRGLLIDTIAEVLRTYNDLYFTRERLKVALFSEDLAAQTLADNTKRAEIGVMSPLDITTARAALAARRESVIVAERAVRDQENALKRLITSDVHRLLNSRVDITPPPLGIPGVQSLAEALRIAFEKRPDYRSQLLGLEQQKVNLVFVKNQELPRLDVVASFGVNGIDPSLSESYATSFNGRNRSWNLGAVFNMPIGNRGPRTAREIAVLELEQQLIALKDVEQNIMIDLDNAFGQIATGRERIEATRVATLLAAESLAAEEEKLRAGASTTFVVLELQNELVTAQANQLRALLDYNNSVVLYHQRMGITLEVARVSVEESPEKAPPKAMKVHGG